MPRLYFKKMTKTEFFADLKNYFVKDRVEGEFKIVNGSIDIPAVTGQYFRIMGSVLNDGVYEYPAALTDETFDGVIWLMAVPAVVKDLIEKINQWETDNAAVINSPYNSESFGGYSYSKAVGADGALNWRLQFGSQLNKWRKICPY